MSDCLESPLVDVKLFCFFFLQAVILPTTKETTHCTVTDRHTDRHKSTEQIQRDRKTVKEKGSGPETDFERHACRQGTLGRWQ